jgi:hypothetical protein
MVNGGSRPGEGDANLPPTTDPPMTPKWDGDGGRVWVGEGVAVMEDEDEDDALVVDSVAVD